MAVLCTLLETERLRLRRFTPDDADNLYALDSDPEVMRYLTGGVSTPRSAIEAEILPRFTHYDEREPGFGFWAAVDKANAEFLGWFSLRRVDGSPQVAALGFRLRRAVWGRGYATEGAAALVERGFTAMGVERVVATTYEQNRASRRVMEKLGMVLVRRFRYTHDDLAKADTYQTDSVELWEGYDVEYAVQESE